MTVDINELLDMTCDPAILEGLDTCVNQGRAGPRLKLDIFLCREIGDRMLDHGWECIKKYCRTRFGEDSISPYYLVPCLLQVMRPEHVGAWIASGEVCRREPVLSFDDDGLLIGPRDHVTFTKEGVLTPRHYLLYSGFLPGVGLSGGFVDDLLESLPQMQPSYFGLAVAYDLVLLRKYHSERFTKAYIRGPQGLDLSALRNPNFPNDPAGVVTDHRPVGDDPLAQLFPLVRLEVMWSRRDGIKTVQIEELVSKDNSRASSPNGIANRYIHARWDPLREVFVHFDGALRTYSREQYDRRLGTDLKKYGEKAAGYQKVFRVDGSIPLTTWCRLAAKFFQENDLVVEYLGGGSPEDMA